MERKSWDSYYMDIAEEVATRSTCDRLNVGTVIVKDKRIVSTGYNGSVSGMPHCDDVDHLYNDQGRCIRTVHSESNAILYANRHDLIGATAYVTHQPCESCAKLLLQAGVKRVVFKHPYANKHSSFFLNQIEWECVGNTSDKPKLFIISGHSGSGKTSVMRKVMKNELISITTRTPRNSEIMGKDYYFVSQDEFSIFKLVQHSYYGRNDYGVTVDEFNEKIAKGNTFVVTSYDGMKQFKLYYPDSVTILFYTSYDDAVKAMRDRGETDEFIKDRLRTYDEEVNNKIHYDYVVKNKYGSFNETVDIIRKIIKSESK